MGGAGHMLHAIKSLKQNRAQLKGRKKRNQNDLLNDGTTETKVEFKTVDPKELEKIKASIKAEANKSRKKEIILTVVTLAVITAALFYMLS